ncbi:MAG TPA: hypothetical protein ENN78_02710, partial [Candidatus Omnitrophica bacterium]|nr:hypothetical protein [Candidatus Omnitrophota bacterium]
PIGGEQPNYYNFQNYNCRNSDIKSIYELKYIKGFREDLDFPALFDAVTIYTESIKVNINTVSSSVLSALGLSSELFEAILAYRENGGVFESLSYLQLDNPALKAEWDAYRKYFKTGSQYFKMAINAETTKGIKSQSMAIVKRDRESFEVLGWWENFWTE